MSNLWQDIRFSIRTLSKSPGFTLVAVLTMALGIGALSSIFSVVNAALIRKLPYAEPERLVLVDGFNLEDPTQRWSLSYPDFFDLRDRQTTFEAFAARTEGRSYSLRTTEGPEMVDAEIVTSSYFPLLGIKAARGRTFLPEEDKAPARQRVVLLSDDLWHTRFGAEPSVLGRTLFIDDQPYQVIGVLPPGFRGLTDQAQIFLPLSAAEVLGKDYTEMRNFRWLYAVGRLKPGTTVEQAQGNLDAIAAQLERIEPVKNKGARTKVIPLEAAWRGELRQKLMILLAGGFFLLLIVCTNLANLLLARFVARRRDLSLRMALGAGRRGLVRQILTESVILALLGCGAGLLVARWSAGLLVKASGIPLKSFVDVNVDFMVVGVILAVSILAGLLFGLVPALVLSTKLRLYEIFNESSRRGGHGEAHHRFQNMLIVGEVALALVLLVCAGLMGKGFQRLYTADLGFGEKDVLTVRMNIKGLRYKEDPPVFTLATTVQQQIAALPGVESAALEGPMIPSDDWAGAYFTLHERQDPENAFLGVLHYVSPGYFQTLGVRMERGREFESTDIQQGLTVAVVSLSLAEEFWPDQNPIGKQILLGKKSETNKNKWATVVGVARDINHAGLLREDQRPPYNVYLCLLQKVPRLPARLNLLVRAEGSASALAPEVQARLRELAPDVPVYDVMTLEERLAGQTASNRSFVLLMSLFAFFALALAAVGVYGVVSYSVANRTQEIGVRMALGAQLRDVLRLVVSQGSRLALMGVALGLLLAALVTPILADWLFGVSPLDKYILVSMSLLLLGVAVAASYIPARRAAKVAPFQALRLE